MPTVLRIGPYRFFFYAGDRDEPPHIHVEREDKIAKCWLNPIRLWSDFEKRQSTSSTIHGGMV
jgi:hypothetical protein